MNVNLLYAEKYSQMLRLYLNYNEDFRMKQKIIAGKYDNRINDKNKDLLKIFLKENDISQTIIKYNYIILICSVNGTITGKKANNYISGMQEYKILKINSNIFKLNIGLNAVEAAHELKDEVYVPPIFHTTKITASWHEYCIPVKYDSRTIGYLDVISINNKIENTIQHLAVSLEKVMTDAYKNTMTVNYIFNKKKELTTRQKKVLTLLVQGLQYKEIGEELEISLSTVKYYVAEIKRKLNAKNEKHCIAIAVKDRYVDGNDVIQKI